MNAEGEDNTMARTSESEQSYLDGVSDTPYCVYPASSSLMSSASANPEAFWWSEAETSSLPQGDGPSSGSTADQVRQSSCLGKE